MTLTPVRMTLMLALTAIVGFGATYLLLRDDGSDQPTNATVVPIQLAKPAPITDGGLKPVDLPQTVAAAPTQESTAVTGPDPSATSGSSASATTSTTPSAASTSAGTTATQPTATTGGSSESLPDPVNIGGAGNGGSN